MSVTGRTTSADFPLVNALLTAPATGFVARVAAAGTSLSWSTYIPGIGRGVAQDASGTVYVTGGTSSSAFPVVDAIQGTLQGATDAFIDRISPAGTAFEWSTYLGGAGGEQAWEIAVDAAGTTVAIVGDSTSLDYPTPGGYQTVSAGAAEAVLTVFDAPGTGSAGGGGSGGGGGGCGLLGLEVLLLAVLLRRRSFTA